MVILSRFKDFYDHISHMYGGGDPKVVYARYPLGEPLDQESNSVFRKTVEIELRGELGFQFTNPYRPDNHKIKHLIVAGVPYTLRSDLVCKAPFEKWSDWVVLNPKEYQREPKKKKRWDFMYPRRYMPDGIQDTLLVTLSQKLGHPVFIIEHVKRSWTPNHSIVVIEGAVPSLGELGFASIKSAEQTYQDISYFVGNTMLTPTPDNMPVVKQTDKEKILAHGLDPKISFRHRKM